jgi:hypothetical protein
MEKVTAYFKKHILYALLVNVIGGIGIGILITYPFAGIHPVRWGVAFLVISLLGYLYTWFAKN